jgi:Cation efflux family
MNQCSTLFDSLNTAYVVLEASFGLLSGSLALLADAGHNLSDVLGLLIGWGASWLSNKPPTPERTYGYKRAPILASLANAVILFIAVGGIAWEAVRRLTEPASIESGTILWVAVVGVLVNAGTAWLFMRGRKGDLNIRGAFLHMAADAGVTVGVIVAGPRHRLDGLAMARPGHQPRHRGRDPGEHLGAVAGRGAAFTGHRAAKHQCGPGAELPGGTAGGSWSARSAYLAAEHHGDGANSPPRAPERKSGGQLPPGGDESSAGALRYRSRHVAD